MTAKCCPKYRPEMPLTVPKMPRSEARPTGQPPEGLPSQEGLRRHGGRGAQSRAGQTRTAVGRAMAVGLLPKLVTAPWSHRRAEGTCSTLAISELQEHSHGKRKLERHGQGLVLMHKEGFATWVSKFHPMFEDFSKQKVLSRGPEAGSPTTGQVPATPMP